MKFNNLCKLAALICQAPRAVIVLKNKDSLELLASFGILDLHVAERDFSLSAAATDCGGLFEVPDLLEHPQYRFHPAVQGSPFMRFYVGASICDPQGNSLGAICVSGDEARQLEEGQREALLTLAGEVYTHLALKTREEELADQYRRFEDMRSLSAISPEMYGILDYNGNVLYVNPAVERILGYTPLESKQMTVWETCYPADMKRVVKKLEEGLTNGEKEFSLDFRVLTKSGGVRMVSWTMVVRNRRWYVYGRDITESKRVEKELQNLSFVASKVNNAIVINDANNHVTWVNEAFEKITGFTLDDLKGHRLGDLIAGPKTDMSLIEHARELNRQNKSFTVDFLAYRKNKKPIWVSIYNTLIMDEQGNNTAEIEIIIDITEKKLAEQEMLEAKEQALQLGEAKEMFISVMSHEIRTPLNAILGMTHLLMENDPRAEQLDDLNILKFSGENLLNIVNDILDFTKIETGNLQLESIPFSLRVLVNDILNSLQVNADRRNNKLNLVFDEQVPERILGDKTRLYQILINLLGNALKFTENGTVELEIKLEQEGLNQVVLFFKVKDTGIGIAADKQRYVFESFTQAKSDISRKYGGTGLGLAITKKLVELHDSEIFLESSEGEGAAFHFRIAFDKIRAAKPASATEEVIPLSFKDKKILVVDDNEINLLICKRILNKWGLSVDLANNGTEAVEKVHNGYYDLVFMDITMPDIDGYEATCQIRNLDGDYFKTLPIVALTASSLNEEAARYEESKMNGHLMKPLNPDALKVLITSFFS